MFCLFASNSSSTIIDLKPTRKLTNSYIEALVLAKRRARRDWQSSRSSTAKLRPTEASHKLTKTLHEEEELKENEYIEILSRDHKTNYSVWKATKTVKASIESEKPLRKRNS